MILAQALPQLLEDHVTRSLRLTAAMLLVCSRTNFAEDKHDAPSHILTASND